VSSIEDGTIIDQSSFEFISNQRYFGEMQDKPTIPENFDCRSLTVRLKFFAEFRR
jgi:hypothetical protein